MRPLKILVLGDDHGRVHGALSIAVSAAALGRQTAIFFQGRSVGALAAERIWMEEAGFGAAGIATIGDLIGQCAEFGVPLTACESGLHMTRLNAGALRADVETGGLISFLAGEDAELLTA